MCECVQVYVRVCVYVLVPSKLKLKLKADEKKSKFEHCNSMRFYEHKKETSSHLTFFFPIKLTILSWSNRNIYKHWMLLLLLIYSFRFQCSIILLILNLITLFFLFRYLFHIFVPYKLYTLIIVCARISKYGHLKWIC